MTFEEYWKVYLDHNDFTHDVIRTIAKEKHRKTWNAGADVWMQAHDAIYGENKQLKADLKEVEKIVEEHKELVRQQEEITDMCIVSWVSTIGTLKEKVQRLIQNEISIALDPCVSLEAKALTQLGRIKAMRECAEIVNSCAIKRHSARTACKIIRENIAKQV